MKMMKRTLALVFALVLVIGLLPVLPASAAEDANGTVDNAHLFGFILIMRRLLSAEDFQSLKTEMVTLTSKIPFVEMKYYGFPDDWQNLI